MVIIMVIMSIMIVIMIVVMMDMMKIVMMMEKIAMMIVIFNMISSLSLFFMHIIQYVTIVILTVAVTISSA